MEEDIECENIKRAVRVIQSMIDISCDRLEGLRTQCATSAELTQQEIRTLEGKLIKLFSRQLVTKAKIKDVELSFDLYNIPCLSQWLRVVGLCQNSIEKVCYRVSNLEMLQEKSDHELRALLSTARDEEIRRLCRAMFNLKKYTEVVLRGATEVEIPLYWDSWDRHHLQEGSPRGGRGRTTRASLPSEDTLGLTNNALDPTTHKKVWIKFPTTPPARRPQQHLATGTDLVGADGSKEAGVGGAALTKSRSHESQLVVRQDLLYTELSNDVCVSAVDPSPVPATTPATVTQLSPPAASLETHASHPQSEDTIHKSLTTPRSPRTPTVPRCMAHYIAHRFTKTFKMKATCDYCDKPMFLGAGLKCKECKYKCHRDCESKVPASCGLPQEFVEEFRRLLESDGTVYPSNQSPGPPRRLSGLDGGGGAAGVGGVGGVGGIGGVSGVGALSSTIATIPKHKRPRQHHISANTPFTCGQDSSSNTSSCNSSTPSSPAPATPHTPRTPVPSLTHLKHQFHFPEVKKGHSLSGILAVGAGAEDTCPGSSVTPASPARGVVAPPTTQSAQSVSLSTCVESEVSWSSSASAASERPAAHADTTDSDAAHTPAACPTAPAQPDDRWPRQNSLSMKEWDIPWDELHLGEVLGQGRFGTVYRGSWHGAIAVKVLNVQYLQDDEGALNSFKHEVATFRKTRHENLVLFMGACMKPPKQAIVTSLCKGNTLYTLIHLRKDKFTMNKAAIVAQQISQGMGYLHARGILHKDLKSKNIFLENGKVVITDFGLFSVTKLCFGNNAQADSIGIPAGWLCYLAPELVRALRPRQPGTPGDLPFSTATDVYSFGTVWYELLCGEWPFKGQPPESVIWQVGTGVKQALSSLQASRDVKDILMLCWSYRRAERPDFARLLSTLEKLPRKRLARSPSHPLHLSRSAESVF